MHQNWEKVTYAAHVFFCTWTIMMIKIENTEKKKIGVGLSLGVAAEQASWLSGLK